MILEVLKKHEVDLGLYDGVIDGCKGCDWKPTWSSDGPSDWEQYQAHLQQYVDDNDATRIEVAIEYDPHWQDVSILTEEEALTFIQNHPKNGCIYMLATVAIPS